METASAFGNPALTVALALAAGVIAQSVARHLRVPGIVVLLAVGVVLGPDVAGLIQPDGLGPALLTLVGFAVAVILFEGGMNLNLRRLRREARSIRQLVTLGALVTAVGGTLAAKLILGWSWRPSVLFGTLVIVTGPTVITPLLRRIKVQRSVATVLEAEGVLIDAVGAIVAIVALEVALSPSGASLAKGVLAVVSRLGFGVVFGLVGGLLLALVLRFRNLVPEGLENVFTLSLVLALYQGSNAILTESGIASVTIAGLVVGNARSHVQKDLLEFKEQLTVLLIGMLFVLLAADVRLAEVRALGVRGLLTVAALMLVVRPLNVVAGTWGTDLNWRQKAFMGWIGPRGIVAAAVASLFAVELERHGLEGGGALRAMVFLVIAVTVVVSGLTGGLAARALGLKRPTDQGWVILGANEVGRLLGGVLKDAGEEVLVIDANPDACNVTQASGLRCLYGNALEERTLQRAEIDIRAGVVALTPNEEVNLLFAQKARREGGLRRLSVALKTGQEGVTRQMVHDAGVAVLFGGPEDVQVWIGRLRRDAVIPQRWRLGREPDEEEAASPGPSDEVEGALLPIAYRRGGRGWPVTDATRLKKGDEATWLVYAERAEAGRRWLEQRGWVPLDGPAPRPAEPSPAEASV